MSYIYLGSPYTHSDPNVMEQRYRAVREATALLTRAEYTVYSPIVHYHDLAKHYVMPKDFAFWTKHNINMLRHANLFAMLTLPGWADSKGLDWEYDYAIYSNLLVWKVSLEGIRSGEDLLKLAEGVREPHSILGES